jgi:hypothetical protein
MDSTSFELLWWMVIFTNGVQRSSIHDRSIKHLMGMVLLSLCVTSVLRYVVTRLDIFRSYHQRRSHYHQLCFSTRLKRSYPQCIIVARYLSNLEILEQPILV